MTTITPPTPLAFLDVETDGLHAGRRIWEYAVIRRDFTVEETDAGTRIVNAVDTEHHAFVGIDLRNSDPFGLKVGGFWDRHPSGRKISGKDPIPGPVAQSKHDAARDLMRLTYGAHLVGVNPAFDADTIAALLRCEGYLPAWDYHLEDLVAETVGYLRAQYAPLPPSGGITDLPWKSDELAAAVFVEPPAEHERHTAIGDARWVKRWYDALVGGAR